MSLYSNVDDKSLEVFDALIKSIEGMNDRDKTAVISLLNNRMRSLSNEINGRPKHHEITDSQSDFRIVVHKRDGRAFQLECEKVLVDTNELDTVFSQYRDPGKPNYVFTAWASSDKLDFSRDENPYMFFSDRTLREIRGYHKRQVVADGERAIVIPEIDEDGGDG